MNRICTLVLALPLLFAVSAEAGELCADTQEYQTAKLACPSGQIISKIIFASYGTSTGSCGAYRASSCSSSTSMSVVGSACLNKASCSVAASNTIFGNPCPGVYKSLAIEAECAAPSAPTLLGIVPSRQPNNVTFAEGFANWLGNKVSVVLDYGNQSSWLEMVNDSDWAVQYYKGTPYQLVFSVPLTMEGTSLASVANGSNDKDFNEVAKALAAAAPNAIVRIGWEFNGNWYAWSVNKQGNATEFKAAYRHVHGIFKAASSKFKFDWCPNWGSSSSPADAAYPGNDVVDYIGMDVYDQSGKAATDFTSKVIDAPYGLAWLASYAAGKGKPIAIDEWGAGQHGDDPAFIEGMYNWIKSHNVHHQNYWEGASSYSSDLLSGKYPEESAMYKKLF